jgi:glutamate-1-semialdehyde 2,1-aminomutase
MMLDQGFLGSTSYYAMYAHTEKHCADYLKAADNIFAEIANLQRRGKIEEAMKGKPATAGFKRLT